MFKIVLSNFQKKNGNLDMEKNTICKLKLNISMLIYERKNILKNKDILMLLMSKQETHAQDNI
jgi:hypothetical protein